MSNASALNPSERLRKRVKNLGRAVRVPTYDEIQYERNKLANRKKARAKQRASQRPFTRKKGHRTMLVDFKGEKDGN